MNPNWPRWIWASVSKWFSDIITPNIPMYVEGDDRGTGLLATYTEFRMDGPTGKEQNKGIWALYIAINVLVVVKKNETDTHTQFKIQGQVTNAFTQVIPIYRYGDDDGFIDCLTLRTDNRNGIIISQFGQISPDLNVLQSTIEGHYRGIFKN